MPTREEVSGILRRLGVRPSRRLGQNFLLDPGPAEWVAERAAELGEEVLEIGPGLGILTEALLERGLRVRAVEIDARLYRYLLSRLRGHVEAGLLQLVHGDALDEDFRGRLVVGNLPFSITSPTLEKMVEEGSRAGILMLQEEVARRILSRPGSGDYGRLTVFVRAHFGVRPGPRVPRTAFHPVPEVDSRILVLEKAETPDYGSMETFAELLRIAFSGRRKKLKNALKGTRFEAVLEEIPELGEKRPGELDISEFALISRLYENRYEEGEGDPQSDQDREDVPEE